MNQLTEAAVAAMPKAPLATVVLDSEALLAAILAALTDPRVVEAITFACGRGAGPVGGTARFMDTKEYARHVRVSPRTVANLRAEMTEGVHYSRAGRRVRFHVAEADEFVAKHQRPPLHPMPEEADLNELARREAARRIKLAPARGK